MQIKYKDLTWPLKLGLIGGYLGGGFIALSFMVGIIQGIIGV